ncbi:hypothetical protein [Actinomyces wuliandei]|uniref:hypothetical protein n=1 Tax=Actinomyces wuliandei TaxID=2057743 RepID=UPI001117B6E5|nr:hypothetical protein [Actinomyces wuliandei]
MAVGVNRAPAGAQTREAGAAVLCVVAAVLALGAVCSLGVLLGARLPWYLAYTTAVVVPYMWILLASTTGPVEGLGAPWVPADDLPWVAWRTATVTLVLRAALWAAALLLVWLVLARCRRSLLWAGVVTLVGVSVACGLHGVRSVPVAGAEEPVCRSGSGVVVCTPRFAAAGLEDYHTDVVALLEVFPVEMRPTAVVGGVEAASGQVEGYDLGEEVLYAPSGYGEDVDTALTARTVTADYLGCQVLAAGCAAEGAAEGQEGTEVPDSIVVLLLWWWQTADVDGEASSDYLMLRDGVNQSLVDRADALSAQADGVVSSWMADNVQDIRDCSVDLADLP